MSWLSNVVVVGTPVDGIASVKIPLPGSDFLNPLNFRDAVVDLDVLVEENLQPEPTQNAFYPILSSMKW